MASSKLDGSLAARVHALRNIAAAAEGVSFEHATRVQVLVHVVGDLAAVERAGLWVEFQAPPIVVGTIAVGDLERVAELDDVVSIGSGHMTRPTLDKSGPEIRAKEARALPPGYSGAGVVVGVVDTGIDIFHHAFRKADGKTRIVSLLDLTLRQSITTTGNPTAGTITLSWQPPRPPTPPGGAPPALPPVETTTALAIPLTVAAVKTALEAFNSINPGDVIVTEGPPPTKPIMVDFAGQYGTPAFDSGKVNLFTLTPAGLTPPTAKVQVIRGREFLPAEINAALQTPNTPFASRDMDGHGTHVAGIAAGDGSQSGTAQESCTGSNTYVGIAPEADLAIVRTTFAVRDNIRGVQHIFDQGWIPSPNPKKPAVVNLSLGGLIGAHDGTGEDEIAFDGMLTGSTQRMIVIAAGNDGNLYDHATPATQPKSGGGLHARKTAATGTPPTPGAPVTLEVMIQPKDRSDDFFDIWYTGAGRLSFALTTPNPGGVSLAAVAAGSGFSTPTLAGHPLQIISNTNVAPFGKHRINVVLKPPAGGQITPGPWTITLRETAGTATDFDCWIAKDTDDPHPRFAKLPDQDRTRTVAIPGTANLPITIGSYNPDDEHLSALADSSGRGPTTDGRDKPELCAPGVGITAALSGARNTGSCCDSCATFYVDNSGTSMAAPHVAGVVALMMQANPAIDHVRIKAELIAGHRPPEPGAGAQPNTSGWGVGRVNAEEAVKKVKPATAMVSTVSADDEPLMLSASAYPANYLPARARLRRLERRVTGSPAGQLAAALISEHVDEVVRLVNTERRVIVAWHRMHGPVLLRLLLGDVDREVLVPRTLDGVPVADGLARLLDELARAGGPALRAAIVQHRTFALALPGARMADLDRVLRVS
jgi:subtilisin family serine protease